jgi:hypothetical protein
MTSPTVVRDLEGAACGIDLAGTFRNYWRATIIKHF